MIIKKLRNMGNTVVRFAVNDVPARLINGSYNAYSMMYRGQISLGLPVSKELIVTQTEIRKEAIGKLALALYHVFLATTGSQISRDDIKRVIVDELGNKRFRLTEKVILLTESDLSYLCIERFGIPKKYLTAVLNIARRRRILKEALPVDSVPIYFESDIEEKEQNGRGDYETVYYRDFTEEGNEIAFRRIVSMEAVTAGDNQPAVVLIPGFANNSNCFNINNRYSTAKNMADRGFWVYLFDPRGVGVNKGRFDPLYTIDSMSDYHLPTVARFIYSRSHGKPLILAGHSMGGLVAENMVTNWSLRRHFDEIDMLDTEQKAILGESLPNLDEAEKNLKMVCGVISLASPKAFQKKSHIFFPTALWLNHLSRIFRFRHVPVEEISKAITEIPGFRQLTRFILNHNIGDLNFFISPENHKEDKYFVERYLKVAMESIPLGLGFQCLKAIYSGDGFKRMDGSRLNYATSIRWFPDNIPVFHFWGTRDSLASTKISHHHDLYPHRTKKTYHLGSPKDLKKVQITSERSQHIDFVIEGANHLDLLYGKVADQIV
ncbi:MAG: lysophospholipase, partial [Deltaproteobacteria bacterium]|nr:lysophospholipase [Deltaproteobacteria bacterium]